MLRTLGGVLVLLICVGILPAEEVKGKVKKVDAAKGYITVIVGEKNLEATTNDKTKFLDDTGKEIPGGLKASAFKAKNLNVSLKYEKKGDKNVATEVKLLSKKKDK
jgi:hypothetical protein